MKNIRSIIILIAAGIAMCMASCSEDELQTFDDTDNVIFRQRRYITGAVNIDYSVQWQGATRFYRWKNASSGEDSIHHSFARINKDIDTLYIPLQTMGVVRDYDRKVNCTVASADTVGRLGVDFRLMDAFVPAGSAVGMAILEVSRANLASIQNFRVDLKLLPNEHFEQKFVYTPRSNTDGMLISTVDFRVFVDDELQRPTSWYAGYFGEFSRKKLFILIDELGLTWEIVDGPFNVSIQLPYASMLKRYLAQKKKNGETVYEEDGVTEMTAGPSV